MADPSSSQDLKALSSHFAFGRNWESYASRAGDLQLERARLSLQRLLTKEELLGKSFLDIGCGSGVHSVAAGRLGARSVTAVDIDPICVQTAQGTLSTFLPDIPSEVVEASIFDQDLSGQRYDIVYSWGVLHHTGAMTEAVERAASLVSPGGLFVFALYRRTALCWLWKLEKRWYSASSPGTQRMARSVYKALLRFKFFITRRSFEKYTADYCSDRGMDFDHDVHDWMGGYPYESITPAQVDALMRYLGLEHVRSRIHRAGIGFFGSGCDEYVYRKGSSRE